MTPDQPTRPPATLPVNEQGIPPALQARSQFLLWGWEFRQGKNGQPGKWTKPPLRAVGQGYARSTDATTWTDYATAIAACLDRDDAAGVGFALQAGGGIFFADFDYCRDPETGEIAPWAQSRVERFKHTFIEVSPKGTGLKVIGFGRLPPDVKHVVSIAGAHPKAQVELYDHARYTTLTGHRLAEAATDLADAQDALDALCAELRQASELPKRTLTAAPAASLDDDAILELALASKHGDRLRRLFVNGDLGAFSGNHSSADQSLVNSLAFWYGPDPARIDRMFRRSALMRPKWDEKHASDGRSYGRLTIDKALHGRTEFFSQGGREPGSRSQNPQESSADLNSVINVISVTTPEPWETPLPFNEYSRPPFPETILPSPLREFAEALAVASQTPLALPAMTSLAAVAAAAAKRVAVQVRAGWEEPVCLYSIVVLDSGNRKSKVVAEVSAPLQEFEIREQRRMAPEIAQAEVRRSIATKGLEEAQRKAARAEGDDFWKHREDAQRLAKEIAESPDLIVPSSPRVLVDDITPEKLGALMADNGGRMAVLSAEGGIFDVMSGRFSKDGKSPNLELFLKGHAGEDLPVDRIGRAAKKIPKGTLTLGLAIQTHVLRGLASRASFRGTGMIARCVFSNPTSFVGHRKINPPPLPEEMQQQYSELIDGILALQSLTASDGSPKGRPLLLDEAASARFIQFETKLEPRLGPAGDLGHIADWGSKLAGLVARIAGLFHTVESVAQGIKPWEAEIDVVTIDRVIHLAEEFLIPHALIAFAEMGADPEMENANVVLAAINRWEDPTFSRRDLYRRSLHRQFTTPDDLDKPLNILIEHRYIQEVPILQSDTPRRGRKPSPTYEINPLWRSQNPQNAPSQDLTPGTIADLKRQGWEAA